MNIKVRRFKEIRDGGRFVWRGKSYTKLGAIYGSADNGTFASLDPEDLVEMGHPKGFDIGQPYGIPATLLEELRRCYAAKLAAEWIRQVVGTKSAADRTLVAVTDYEDIRRRCVTYLYEERRTDLERARILTALSRPDRQPSGTASEALPVEFRMALKRAAYHWLKSMSEPCRQAFHQEMVSCFIELFMLGFPVKDIKDSIRAVAQEVSRHLKAEQARLNGVVALNSVSLSQLNGHLERVHRLIQTLASMRALNYPDDIEIDIRDNEIEFAWQAIDRLKTSLVQQFERAGCTHVVAVELLHKHVKAYSLFRLQ